MQLKGELLELESLAKNYVQLTSCEQKLKCGVNNELLETTLGEATAVSNRLTQILDMVHQAQSNQMTEPFQSEREAYLIAREERKKAIENEIRRESDKIDEYYAKKTRDSIYQNLVGNNKWT